jgi:DNA-directed RNA polymerase specialized sigma24 family protein
VSERRSRSGARPGVLSAELRSALRAEAERLSAPSDATAVVRAVGDFYAELDRELERIAAVRIAAIRRLRAEGWTYEQIADATGLSKARVAQLARAGQVGGRSNRAKRS